MLASPSSEITEGLQALGEQAIEPLAEAFPGVRTDSERYGIGVALAAGGLSGERALVQLARTPGLRGRRWLLVGLGGRFTPAVVAALRELVRDADRDLAERAVLDLADSEDDQGVVILRGVLRSPDPALRRKAALALAFHADASGVPLLLEDLRDAKGGALVLFQTMKGLGLSGAAAAVGPLAQMFVAYAARVDAEEPPGRITGLADFEARFRRMPVSQRAMLVASNAAGALVALEIHGPHPELIPLVTHANPVVRRMALEVLGACGDASAAPAVMRVIEAGLSRPGSARGPVRAGTDAGHRGELGEAPEGAEGDGPGQAELMVAAQALRSIAVPAQTRELVALARRAPPELTGWIALALAAVGDPDGVRRAVGLASGHGDLALAAISTLGRSSAPEAVSFLVSLMEGADRDLQLVAASSMSRPGHRNARAPLDALLASGRAADDPQRLSVAALGLGLIGDAAAVKPLEALLRHKAPGVRRSAVVGLWYLTGEARRYQNVWGEETRFEPTTFHLKMRQETMASAGNGR